MKEVQFYLAEDWRGIRTKKILEIKNKKLFMEYVRISEFCFGDSKVSEWFYEDEIEAIKFELKREKEKLTTGYCNGWNDAVEEFNSVNGIPVIYNSLYKLKAKYPSLRFGQIFYVFNEYLEKYNSDPYYISDEEYVKEVEKFVDKLTDANVIF